LRAEAAACGRGCRRDGVLSNLDTAEPLVIHTAAAAGVRYPYEVLFRTLNKFLMDTACGEYLFCEEFWAGDAGVFRDILQVGLAAPSARVGTAANCLLHGFGFYCWQ
jgi:hypothetical protein